MVTKTKEVAVQETVDRLERSQAVILIENHGLTVAEISELRNKLREQDSELKVVKNRLMRRALSDAGYEEANDLLNGPTAFAFGYTDGVAPAKACSEFAKEHDKLEIKGGFLEKSQIGMDKIEALAKLPGREELLTQMAGTMLAPMRQMATSMHQAVSKMVYAMKDRASQLEEA
jgi:large subunit ribosomal protein L10